MAGDCRSQLAGISEGGGCEIDRAVPVPLPGIMRCPSSAVWAALLGGVSPYPIIELPRKEPANAKHIDGGADGAVAEAVFAKAELPRPVINRHLDEPIAGALDQRRNESVHALERHERADAFASHRLQGAAGVPHAVLRETAAHEIRDAARDPFYDRVFSFGAVTDGEIGAAFQFRQQFRDIGGIILQVA